MSESALIILDVQTNLVNGIPNEREDFLCRIQTLLKSCREKSINVIYVRHESSTLVMNSPGWQICEEIAPLAKETVFDKHFNSMFKETPLLEYLKNAGIKNIILCGMKTERCVDVSIKVAFEYGFNVIVPKNLTATTDNEFFTAKQMQGYYEEHIWQKRLATVITSQCIIDAVNSGNL